MHAYRYLLIGLILIALAFSWLFFSRHSTPTTTNPNSTHSAPASTPNTSKAHTKFAQDKPTPVFSEQASYGNLTVWAEALGKISARQQVVLRSRIDGELLALHFNEGQLVKRGQLLAEIDARPLRAQLAQQKAQLAKDQALLANSKQDLARYNQLLDDDAIAAQQRDTQQALVQQYQATIKSDLAQIQNTELQLSYTQIHAPLSGKIGFRQVDVGNQIKSSDANGLANIVEIDPITVIFSLPETYLAQINQPEKQLNIELWNADKSQQLSHTTQWIMDNQIDATTGSIRLKAIVDNPQQQFLPNQFVNVRIALTQLYNQLRVPAQTILYGTQGEYVYRINDAHRVEVVPVKRLQTDGNWVAVQGDLHDGDRLVSDGSDRLRPGSLVTIINKSHTTTNQPATPNSNAH